MDYLSAVDVAVRDVGVCDDPDDVPVQAALQLALHAWQLCDYRGAAIVDWDLFGTGVQTALDNLHPAAAPLAVRLDEQRLPDTTPVREGAARLATAVASRLEAAAGDPNGDPDRRWAWSTAAARLQQAAEDVASTG